MDLEQHMTKRLYFLFTMCSLSAYTWATCSVFAPMEINFWSIPYQNCVLFLFYLAWDTWSMFNNPVLFRKDLMIHHIIGSVVFGSMSFYIPIVGSMALINECISLMNTILKDPNRYRLFCIFCIRLPVCGFFTLYYVPYRFYEFKGTLTDEEYWFVYYAHKINYLFLLYDFYLIKTIVGNMRRKNA